MCILGDNDVHPRLAKHGEGFPRRFGVGDQRVNARQRTDNQAAMLDELGGVRQNDELVGALEELGLGAGDERIALDCPEGPD